VVDTEATGKILSPLPEIEPRSVLSGRLIKLRGYIVYRSRGSSVSIVSNYGMDDRAIGIRSPTETEDFFSNLRVQTGSGAHPASCPMGTGGP
jgi:hypothetical protein